jgi:hypothetical protein
LFRHYYALPSMRDSEGLEVAAVRGVLTSILKLIEDGATHIDERIGDLPLFETGRP